MKHSNDRTEGLNSQLAVEAIGNRYDLILVGARRMRELGRGDQPKLKSKFSHAVTTMLEIIAVVDDGTVYSVVVRVVVAAPRNSALEVTAIINCLS